MDWGEDRWTGHTHRRTLQSMAVKNTSHSKTVTPDRDGGHERMNFQVVPDSCGICGLRSDNKLEENKMVTTSCFLC